MQVHIGVHDVRRDIQDSHDALVQLLQKGLVEQQVIAVIFSSVSNADAFV